jgi:hypothetical protein
MILQKDGDLTTKQCELANRAFGLTGCCGAPSGFLCNQPLPVIQVASEWLKAGFSAIYDSGTVSFSTIQLEIGAGRPIEVGIAWSGGGGHAILIVGWNHGPEGQFAVINDPKTGTGSIPLQDVISGFGMGEWKWTWLGIKKE